jgi:hypothetical protein
MMEVFDSGRDQLFTHQAKLENGQIVLGDAPGSGIVFDEDVLERNRANAPSPRSLRSIYRRSPGTWIDEFRSTLSAGERTADPDASLGRSPSVKSTRSRWQSA